MNFNFPVSILPHGLQKLAVPQVVGLISLSGWSEARDHAHIAVLLSYQAVPYPLPWHAVHAEYTAVSTRYDETGCDINGEIRRRSPRDETYPEFPGIASSVPPASSGSL